MCASTRVQTHVHARAHAHTSLEYLQIYIQKALRIPTSPFNIKNAPFCKTPYFNWSHAAIQWTFLRTEGLGVFFCPGEISDRDPIQFFLRAAFFTLALVPGLVKRYFQMCQSHSVIWSRISVFHLLSKIEKTQQRKIVSPTPIPPPGKKCP